MHRSIRVIAVRPQHGFAGFLYNGCSKYSLTSPNLRMPGIYIAALLTSLLGLVIVGTIVWQVTRREDRGLTLALGLVALPLSASTYYCVRKPIDRFLEDRLGKESGALTAVRLCYAPVTEEPAKLLPLLLLALPQFRG